MIVKITSYTRIRRAAKATIRYIMHRPDREGERKSRSLFGEDGLIDKSLAYDLIDEAIKGSVFFRVAISPDPAKEDANKDLDLNWLTQVAMSYMKEKLKADIRFKSKIQFFAAEHGDQSDVRHINALIVFPGRLNREQFRAFPKLLKEAAATEAKLQRQELDKVQTTALTPTTYQQSRMYPYPESENRGVSNRRHMLAPTKPSCPECGFSVTLWKVDEDLYVCPDCGSRFEGVGYSISLQQEDLQLSL